MEARVKEQNEHERQHGKIHPSLQSDNLLDLMFLELLSETLTGPTDTDLHTLGLDLNNNCHL